MLFKIYFWIILIAAIIGSLAMLSFLSKLSIADWRGVLESILIVVGTYTYIFRKKIFNQSIWQKLFWLLSILWIIDILYFLFLENQLPLLDLLLKSNVVSGPEAIFSIILGLPALYAIHKLGFPVSNKH